MYNAGAAVPDGAAILARRRTVDFGLSEEQLLLQHTVRDFLAREYPAQKRRDVFDGEVGHDRSL